MVRRKIPDDEVIYYENLKKSYPPVGEGCKAVTALSDASIVSYRSQLLMLEGVTGVGLIESITKNVDKTYKKLQSKYASATSRKGILTAILSMYSHNPDLKKKHKAAHKAWVERHHNVQQVEKETRSDNRMTKEMADELPTSESINKAIKNLGKELKANKFADDQEALTADQHHLLLCMMSMIPPKRNDLGNLKIYQKDGSSKKGAMGENPPGNYIILPAKGTAKLVMEEYKTAKTFGVHEEELPPELTSIIRDSLKRHPREYLFVGRDMDGMKADAYRKFIKRVFLEQLGIETSINSIRHAYITLKADPNELTDAERAVIAKKMNHSLEMQGKYRVVGFKKAAEEAAKGS